MPAPTDCPDARELWQYLHGEMPDDRAEVVERHLVDCPLCVELLQRWEGRGRLTQALLGGGLAETVSEDPAAEQLVRRLRGLTARDLTDVFKEALQHLQERKSP